MEQIIENIETEVNETENVNEETLVHVIPEIEIKENFFDFTSSNEEFLTLKLTDLGIIVEDKEKDRQKNISYESLLNALSEGVSLDTGILPVIGNNYIAIRQYLIAKDKHIIIVESSPRQRKVIYNRTGEAKDDLEFHIPFPGLLMCIVLNSVENGKFKLNKDSCRLYALKTPVYNDQTTVYRYPYTNVYADARICWGNSLESLQDSLVTISQTSGFLELFLSSQNNEDLYTSSYAPFAGENAKEMFTKMNQINDYPYETLKKYLTYKEIISLLTNN
jgi:hypothetical protein